ncbi:MAG TPA: tRNA pseudouridine(55) synthase TruB [Deinococcales bacterium]|nr:tRNA pseudouridine(55) synthase TruB [Deinococcales bacterium]
MGVYLVDKPLHETSFDVVAAARRALGTRRVGHTGTLDPLASGLLVVAAGESTKLVQFLTGVDKEYLAFVALGAATATLDAEGPVVEERGTALPDAATLEGALSQLRGEQMQVPPAHSAVQVGGVRAYAAAREGKPLDLPARPVAVHELTLLATLPSMAGAPGLRFAPAREGWRLAEEGRGFGFPDRLGEHSVLVLRARVSSGTYIRSLARDVGLRLGVPAHLAGLVRTRVGAFDLAAAVPPSGLAAAEPLGDLEALALPTIHLDPVQARDARDGKRLPSDALGFVALAHGGRLLAVAEGDGASLRVRRGWSQ